MAHESKTDLFDLRQLWRAGFKYAVVLALNAQLAACIPILAHPVTESNVIEAEFTLADYRFMTLSSEDTPSSLARRLGREIERKLIDAENVDRAEFWKAVFPEGTGKITIQELLKPTLLAKVEPLGPEYLVIIASEPESRKDYGTIVFSRSTLRSRYDIGIIDLRHRGSTKTLYAEAYGKGTVLALPFFAFGRDYPGPNDLDGEVVHELASRIVAEIAPSTEGSRVRFLLLDADTQGQLKRSRPALLKNRDDSLGMPVSP